MPDYKSYKSYSRESRRDRSRERKQEDSRERSQERSQDPSRNIFLKNLQIAWALVQEIENERQGRRFGFLNAKLGGESKKLHAMLKSTHDDICLIDINPCKQYIHRFCGY
jgi:hypothetical protein